jgi:hypothetical protein
LKLFSVAQPQIKLNKKQGMQQGDSRILKTTPLPMLNSSSVGVYGNSSTPKKRVLY